MAWQGDAWELRTHKSGIYVSEKTVNGEEGVKSRQRVNTTLKTAPGSRPGHDTIGLAAEVTAVMTAAAAHQGSKQQQKTRRGGEPARAEQRRPSVGGAGIQRLRCPDAAAAAAAAEAAAEDFRRAAAT